jgi:hypothetical protein
MFIFQNAQFSLVDSFLEAQGEMEQTWRFSQSQLRDTVDVQSGKKIFHLKLQTAAPYRINFSHNGRFVHDCAIVMIFIFIFYKKKNF